jgi:hypothetical protein
MGEIFCDAGQTNDQTRSAEAEILPDNNSTAAQRDGKMPDQRHVQHRHGCDGPAIPGYSVTRRMASSPSSRRKDSPVIASARLLHGRQQRFQALHQRAHLHSLARSIALKAGPPTSPPLPVGQHRTSRPCRPLPFANSITAGLVDATTTIACLAPQLPAPSTCFGRDGQPAILVVATGHPSCRSTGSAGADLRCIKAEALDACLLYPAK